jgi:hypothetical protein
MSGKPESDHADGTQEQGQHQEQPSEALQSDAETVPLPLSSDGQGVSPVSAPAQPFAAVQSAVVDEPTLAGGRSYVELVKRYRAETRAVPTASEPSEAKPGGDSVGPSAAAGPKPTAPPQATPEQAGRSLIPPLPALPRTGLVAVTVASVLGSVVGAVAVLGGLVALVSWYPAPIEAGLRARRSPTAAEQSAPQLPRAVAPQPTGSVGSPAPGAVGDLLQQPAWKRTVAENMLVERHRRAHHARLVSNLREHLQHNPALAKEPATLRHLSILLAYPGAALEAAEALATMPNPAALDVLYAYLGRDNAHPSTVELAEQLLRSQDVSARASAALQVLLQLRQPQTCKEYLALLPQLRRDADQRAVARLEALTKPKRQCGAAGNADCHACLRGARTLDDAIVAAKQRPAPKLP